MEKNKIRAVFLDRDDTIIEDLAYVTKPEQLRLLPGTGAALRRLRLLGYKLFVITNQPAVARGLITEDDLTKIHEKLLSMLDGEGVKVEKIYYCPFDPEGIIEEYKKESYDRKPNPGMLFAARDEMGIELENSWFIGDSYADVSASKAAGCRCILINPPLNPRKRKDNEPAADYDAVNITEAANIIKMFHYNRQKSTNDAGILKQPLSKQLTETTSSISPKFLDNSEITKLLKDIHEAVKAFPAPKDENRFSKLKAFCGFLTATAVMCLIITVIKLIGSQEHQLDALKPLGFAICLQLLAIMFYIVKKDSR